jgi:hypothetical protein
MCSSENCQIVIIFVYMYHANTHLNIGLVIFFFLIHWLSYDSIILIFWWLKLTIGRSLVGYKKNSLSVLDKILAQTWWLNVYGTSCWLIHFKPIFLLSRKVKNYSTHSFMDLLSILVNCEKKMFNPS